MAVEEETPLGERASDHEPVAELDLDDPGPPPAVDAGPVPGQGRGARWRAARPAVAIALAAALAGGVVVHVVEGSRPAGETSLRVGLGSWGARLLNRRVGSRRVILLSTLALNAGSSALTVRGVRVQGDGAGLTRPFGNEASIFPFRLDPGQTGNMPIALTSDCDIEGRAVPRIVVDVTVEDGAQRSVDVLIPGLDEMWRRSTTEQACSDT